MRISKYITISALLAVGVTGCTKLNETYTSTIPASQAAAALGPNGITLLLNAAYADLKDPYISDQAKVFSMEENSTDESVVATRGGDWDDNGAWRSMHAHTWNADHVAVLSTFNALNKLNFDATNVLNFKPSTEIAAEARFLRAFALFSLLDLYGKFPFRNPGDTLLNPPKVYEGAAAAQFIIDELTAIIPDINNGGASKANQDAAKVLLMRTYLNRGMFANRAAPTFDAADMQKVKDLGAEVIATGKYSYEPKYFKNFTVLNGDSKELIWGYPSTSGTIADLNPRMDTRWSMTFHYNEWAGNQGNSGWNGFSTTADFYSTFGGVNGAPVTNATSADTLLDTRLGGRRLSDSFCTAVSGIKPGFVIGQQYGPDGTALKDRNKNPLAYTLFIPEDQYLNGPAIEVSGVRVAKYVPDFTGASVGQNYSNTPGNWMAWMRYPEVKLMIAEADLRTGDEAGAILIVNELRTARGAKLVGASLPLAGATVKDPNTFLAERGRELYWESIRRIDLLRFNMFLTPWTAKTSSDPTYLVFPIPNQALAVNPNLTQNSGY